MSTSVLKRGKNPLTQSRKGFSPKQLKNLAAWYRADILVSPAIDPGTLSGVVARYRADSITGKAPNTIANCTGWFRADMGVTLNGSKVSAWADQSGSGHNLTQAVSANQPTFVSASADFNNQPALSFAADFDWLASASGWSLGANTSIVIIGEDNGGSSGYAGVADNTTWILTAHGGKYSTAGASFVDSTVAVSANTPSVFTMTSDGSSNVTWYINGGVTVGTGNANFAANTSGLVIGALNTLNTSGLVGKIVEVAVFSRALTANEVADIQTYAAIRYKIGVTNTVYAWNDISGSGDANRNASQATAANAPSVVGSDSSYNNNTSISFSGSTCNLQTGVWSVAPPTTGTVIIIGNDSNGSGSAFIDGNTVNSYLIEDGGSGNVTWGLSAYPNATYGKLNTPSVIVATFNGASSALYANTISTNNALLASQNVGSSSVTKITLGNKADNTGVLNGKILECVIINRVLTQAEIVGVNVYASTRYGLSLNLSQWNDQSATGDANQNLVNATYAHQPAFVASNTNYNNQPTVHGTFAGQSYMTTGTWNNVLSPPYTIFVVGNDDGDLTQYHWYFSNNTANLGVLQNGTYNMYDGVSTISTGTPGSSPRVIGALFNGASSKFYFTAKTPITGTMVSRNISALNIMSELSNLGWLTGDEAEIIVYSRALAQSEIVQVLNYLGSRYKITIGA